MAKQETHSSPDNPEMTKVVKQAQAEVMAGKQPVLTKMKVVNPNASEKIHQNPNP